jgi:hypothetical protein
MTQSNRPSHQPAPAAPRIRAGAHESSWTVAPGAEPFSREELLARFRRQRALPEDPFETLAQAPAAPGNREKAKPSAPFAKPAEDIALPTPQQRPGFSMGQTFAIAAAMALAAGATAGLLNASFSPSPEAPAPIAAKPAPVQASTLAAVATPADPPAQTTVIIKKSVPIATLEVSDAAGETNSFIPLALRAEPAEVGSDILLKISGIPAGAYLTSGRKEEDEIWAVTRAELKDLRLVVPEADDPKIDLAVAAFEPQTGELAAPVKTMTVALSDVVVQPASAPPPNQMQAVSTAGKAGHPAPIPKPDSMSIAMAPSKDLATVPSLVLEGDTLLKSGDVRQARLTYEKAWSEGSPAGAFGMARSFDPVVLGSLVRKDELPDKARAIEWYERAAAAGHADATDSIMRLRLKP